MSQYLVLINIDCLSTTSIEGVSFEKESIISSNTKIGQTAQFHSPTRVFARAIVTDPCVRTKVPKRAA